VILFNPGANVLDYFVKGLLYLLFSKVWVSVEAGMLHL
jgi:hypothetical protein